MREAGSEIKSNALPKDRKNVPMPHSFGRVSGLTGTAGSHRALRTGPLGSGILPMGLAGHACNLFLFLDTFAHAV